ncbi:MAG: serine/threonine-protein kinase [Pirellulales bacterium]
MTLRADSTRYDLGDGDAAWEALAERLEAFSEAWDRGGPPSIAEFLPDGPAGLRRMAVVELVKYDLERRWQSGDRRRVDAYVAELPELAEGEGPPADLLYEEFHCRRQAGETVSAEDYFGRYPQQAAALRRMLGVDRPDDTKPFYDVVRVEELEVGTKLDDFDLLARLGRGAFATVFLARQRSMQRMVALKVSADHGQEPQTLAQLDHPHIVRVFDQRILPDRALRLLYMQYVSGGTLHGAMDRARNLPSAERTGKTILESVDLALSRRGDAVPIGSQLRQRLAHSAWPHAVCLIGMQLAEALSYAHSRGVLHRDIKPANVLLTAEGAAQLVDFNISFCAELDGAAPAAYFGGSLAYMSPEQLEACHVGHPRSADSLDGRSDVYSLAVMLWEMLAGERPLTDEQLSDGWTATLDRMIVRRRAGLDADAIERLHTVAPRSMAELLVECLSPNSDDRPATAAQMARRLWCCLRPQTERLLTPSQAFPARFALRWPIAALLLCALVPNSLAAVFNYVYNRGHIVEHFRDAQHVFWNTQTAVNGTAFPIGVAWMVILAWPLSRSLRDVRRGVRPTPEAAAALRERALSLGRVTAVVGIALWSVAGVVYPVAIRLGGADLVWHDFLHFIASLALGGLIAATYPFFAITWLAARAFYPALLRVGQENPADPDGAIEAGRLVECERLTWRYLVLAASLPMFGVTLMVTLGGATGDRMLLAVLSVSSLAGFALIYLLARAVQCDLAALAEIASGPKA